MHVNAGGCREQTVRLSIIIPTLNERDNVRRITERIVRALGPQEGVCAGGEPAADGYPADGCTSEARTQGGCAGDGREPGLSYELWFIDDSRDDTPVFLEELSKRYPFVHVVRRTDGAGLASAVVEGFRRSRGDWMVVMDADLQHPPEVLPALVERLRDGADIVIPSRFVAGGSDGGLNAWRRLVSWTARTFARLAIRRLRPVSDCTSGFFALRRDVIEGVKLRPVGWKILIEVLVKGRYRRVEEIPYHFVARDAGESKMSVREQWNYLLHLLLLIRDSREDRRFYLFAAVGLLGVGVNLAAMTVLLRFFHLPGVAASVVASCAAMVHNFLWNDRITWSERLHPPGWRRALQVPVFLLVSGVGLAMTALAVKVTLLLHGRAFVGQAAGVCIATLWSYQAHNRWTWREWVARVESPGTGEETPRP